MCSQSCAIDPSKLERNLEAFKRKHHLASKSNAKGGFGSRNYKESNTNAKQVTRIGFAQSVYATIGKEDLSV